jgi:hypothetical protein
VDDCGNVDKLSTMVVDNSTLVFLLSTCLCQFVDNVDKLSTEIVDNLLARKGMWMTVDNVDKLSTEIVDKCLSSILQKSDVDNFYLRTGAI